MVDEVWKRVELDSPCIKLCSVHPDYQLCVGCMRSAAEIARWSRLSVGERQNILQDLPVRKKRLFQRRGGRARKHS